MLQAFDTVLPADSVETVQVSVGQEVVVACGTYLLVKGSASDPRDTRDGTIELFQVDKTSARLVHKRTVANVPGVFDLKWSTTAHGLEHDAPLLAQAAA